MSSDEKLTIQYILERLKNGEKTSVIAKNIDGISEKRLRQALKDAGYFFKNTGDKGWHFEGNGEEPKDKNIFDYVKKTSPQKTKNNTNVNKNNTNVNTSNTNTKESNPNVNTSNMNANISNLSFTQEEIAELKSIIKERKTRELKPNKTPNQPLYERIKEIKPNKKTRKTIVIDTILGKQLDDFCNGERVKKSDIIHLALTDFLRKYQKL
ncbi:hypothetical protein [Bacillus cereus]|uniref:hypothetical protein n=1 Tax=Bacillus cereus TaxID=1396 RepID=UPI000BEE264B|nr:hypothetical protein [Bacillus cereus]PED30080.1 hypothetical protein CON13_21605 [Bacillus cereus]PEE50464.1 hypothetical protein COM80_25305 [Bacillus cereus]PFL88587.1 hypothetical protein COJ35_27905 [Bacillus cereus]PFV65140.1 hypothetical protein COL16_26875 [Bacillus cereus]PGS31842.1 hypothetical protein COC56_27770 [Bacillus cereus]